MAARVTMMGAMRSCVTANPLMVPARVQRPSAARSASSGGSPTLPNSSPCVAKTAAASPERANTEPTDRSMPAARITTICPAAPMPISAVCRRMLMRLAVERKSGFWKAKTATRPMNARKSPSLSARSTMRRSVPFDRAPGPGSTSAAVVADSLVPSVGVMCAALSNISDERRGDPRRAFSLFHRRRPKDAGVNPLALRSPGYGMNSATFSLSTICSFVIACWMKCQLEFGSVISP